MSTLKETAIKALEQHFETKFLTAEGHHGKSGMVEDENNTRIVIRTSSTGAIAFAPYTSEKGKLVFKSLNDKKGFNPDYVAIIFSEDADIVYLFKAKSILASFSKARKKNPDHLDGMGLWVSWDNLDDDYEELRLTPHTASGAHCSLASVIQEAREKIAAKANVHQDNVSISIDF